MPSAPVSDSWEGPKRRDATGDAIFGNRFFDSNARPTPLFDLGGRGVRKLFFRKPPRHCAARVRMVSRGAGTLNPSRLGARAAVEAVSIVHDVRYVAKVKSHSHTHENRMTSGGGRVMACICANEPKRFLSGGSCFRETDDLPLRLATSFNLVCALHAAADGSEVESNRGLHGCLVTIWERFFLLSGRHSPRWDYPRENFWEAKRR
jgi:hypothetical protein